MAISYPRTDVFTTVGIADNNVFLQASNQRSPQRNGVQRGKKLGPALWMGSWKTVTKKHDIILDLEAIINSLEDGVYPFYGSDMRRRFPLQYPTGNFNDTFKIATKGANNKSLTMSGGPANFKLSRGDYLHFNFNDLGGKPCRYYGQVMETVTASAAGLTPLFEVRPHFPNYIPVNTAVVLKDPKAVFKLVAGTAKTSVVDPAHSMLEWSAYQSMRINE